LDSFHDSNSKHVEIRIHERSIEHRVGCDHREIGNKSLKVRSVCGLFGLTENQYKHDFSVKYAVEDFSCEPNLFGPSGVADCRSISVEYDPI
jgi:hypothetical protein